MLYRRPDTSKSVPDSRDIEFRLLATVEATSCLGRNGGRGCLGLKEAVWVPLVVKQLWLRAALITICISTILTTPSPFKSLTASAAPSASLISACTSETLAKTPPVISHAV